MSGFESGLRAMIAGIVREELAKLPQRDEYLSTGAAAEYAKVAPGTIRRWIREGRLVRLRAGRVMRVRRADLETLLQIGTRQNMNDLTPEQLARRDFG
jgi:excisionase family DNA binding protein